MAGGALGSLTVKLGLDTAEFTGGLSKADYEAKKFSENVGRVIGQGLQLAAAGFTAFAAAGTAAFLAADKLIGQAADYQDMAEKINGSAEAIASFGVALGTANTSTETLIGASVKLTKGLTGVDDESKAAGAAIAALGLNLDDFKKLAPEAQIEAVAKAMAGFANTTDKTAIAVALFGKSGAELLPFLKALEEQGGRQIILTAEQIAQADEYADKVARVSAEFKQQAQAAATQLIPTLSDAFDIVTDLIRAFSQSEETATLFKVALAAIVVPLQTIAIVGANVAFVFGGVGREIAAMGAQLVALGSGNFTQFRAISDAVKDDATRARAELDAFEKRVMGIGQRRDGSGDFDDAAARAASRPTASFSGAQAKAAKDKQDAAEQYLKKLQEQLNKTRELNVEETLLSDIAAGRLKASSKVSQEQLQAVARQIDQTKEADRVATERQKNRNKDNEDSLSAIREIEKAEADRLRALLDGGPVAQLEKQRETMQFLAKAFEDGKISAEQFNDAAIGNLKLTESLKESKSAAEELGLTFKSSFEDAITTGKSLSDVLKSLGQDLLKLAIRKNITEPLFNSFSGSGFFDTLGGLFGGGKAAGGPVDAGRLYRVNEDKPEMLDVNGSQYLMMGSKGGMVRPNPQGNSGNPLVINVGAGASRSEVIAAVQQGVAASVGIVSASQRRRGALG
jgi:hypothetical protein